MIRSSFLVSTLLAFGASLHAQTPQLTVEAIFGSSAFSDDLPSLQWTADGTHFTLVERDGRGATDLIRVEARTGRRDTLVRGRDLVPGGRTRPITIEEYQFSPTDSLLLIFTNSQRVWRRNTKGEYYLWDFSRKTLTPLSTLPGFQLFAKFSPDGRYIGFVRDNNLFVHDLSSALELQLTHDGGEDVINGTTDWVYEEEFRLRDAYRFSPDGTRIAFWRFDQSAIQPFFMLDETSLYPELVTVRYPKAGTPNSEVRIGVITISSRRTTWIDLGSDRDIYIAEGGFTASGDLWLTRLNRHQNQLDLLLADSRTGSSRVLMTDRDSAWVDASVPVWFDDGRQFLFPSERDGYRQLFVFDRDAGLRYRVTPGLWDVTEVYGVNEQDQVAYFAGHGEGPLTHHVYRASLDGLELERLSADGGWHTAVFNPEHDLYVETFSTASLPPERTLRQADGRLIRAIDGSGALPARLARLELSPPEFMTVPGHAGDELNAFMIRPPDFDPSSQYPLLMYVYGGPGSQTVMDRWGGTRYLWHQLLAQQGFLVASVDNRGTGGRGRDFKKGTYLKLGQLETEDQIAAAQYLGSLPYVDESRIGIWGWSYGGYMSLLAQFRGGATFRAAISVAPVTDWRLYDTIYTERYMRTPRENLDGYERGAPLTFVNDLTGELLVVHGTGDDNVHPQNTTQLIHRLEQAGKQFDMRLYPNKTHSIAGSTTRVNLYHLLTAWLDENLKLSAAPFSLQP